MKRCRKKSRTSLLKCLTRLLLNISRNSSDRAKVDTSGLVQLMLPVIEVLQTESESHVSSIIATVSEELLSVMRQHVACEAVQLVSSGPDKVPLLYTGIVRLVALVLSTVKSNGCIAEMVKSMLDAVVELGVSSLPFGRHHFTGLLLDMLTVIQFYAGVEAGQEGCTLPERFRLLLCDVEGLVRQESDGLVESLEKRRSSSLESLLLVLRADKAVGGRDCKLRHRALW